MKSVNKRLRVVNIYSKYAWVVPMKDKKSITITNTFQKILNEFLNFKCSKFYNRSMKTWLQDNDMEMYSTHNGAKSVVAERFIRTLKNNRYKYMTSVSQNVYIDKLHNIVKKYNNAFHSTIKMKPVDLKSSIYFVFSVEKNDNDPKFEVGDHVRISKYKNIFAKGYAPN